MSNMNVTGGEVRAMRRAMDPKGFTRGQACAVIAGLALVSAIEPFASHANKHVKRYATHKIDALRAAGEAAKLAERVDAAALALAAEFPETPEADVLALVKRFADKPSPIGSARMSLLARKSNAKRRAAKPAPVAA